MPRKNIYIKDSDQEIFEKAEKLGDDNLSAVIAEAIRKYVKTKEEEDMRNKTVYQLLGENVISVLKDTGRLDNLSAEGINGVIDYVKKNLSIDCYDDILACIKRCEDDERRRLDGGSIE